MELKVWCDGIQRVVCGVSSQTTCQDVVFALAHATAQTGRFILIEKFRNNERLLAPNEHPLTVLSKWGEYGNDVTFIMKRSEYSGKTQTNLNLNNSNTSPTVTANAGAVGASSPNRRDIFNNSINRKSGLQQNSDTSSPTTAKPLTTNQTNSSNTTPTPTQTASPLKSNSCLNSSHNNNSTNNANNYNTNTNDLIQTKQQMNNKNNNNCANEKNGSPAKSGGHRPRHPPPYSEAISKSALITGTDRSNSSQLDFDSDDRSFNNKRRSIEPSPQTQSKQRTGSQKELILQRDAIRLVDMQKDTMRSQEMEMSSIESQINSIEKKLLENELLIKRYKEEMECLHQLWLDQEVLIDQLDEQHLEAEMDELVAKAQAYEEEVALVKKRLSRCETDIGDCRQKINQLMDQLEDCERQTRATDAAKEEEMSEQLKSALRDKNKEFESQKTDLQTLNNSIQHLDSSLNEKNTEVDRLLADLKEANIQGLTLQTPEESLKHCTSNGQPFQQRSGSTRRIIGSPRELENAVATNKNPHGVWV